jgi:protein-S-isoprenylcysteine O-methyltransferase Ste14
MWINLIIICIYISFVLDLWVLPIPSEASTASVISSETKVFSLKSIKSIIGLLISLLFYLTPLYLSIISLINSKIKILPIFIVVLGLVIAVLGRIISLSGTIALRENHGKIVVESAIFKRSRNPIVTGMHLTILGLLLCFDFWGLWAVFPIYFWIFHSKIINEESFLESKYGKDYLQYKQRTPRYL